MQAESQSVCAGGAGPEVVKGTAAMYCPAEERGNSDTSGHMGVGADACVG